MPEAQQHSEDRHASVIEQATALRTRLHEAFVRTSDLVKSLKRQKRQSRLVETTLQSLRQLGDVA